MQPLVNFDSIDDICVLEYALHCQCSDLSGPYETASRHLRALHDSLEEIRRVAHCISASREAETLDNAVRECGRLLNAIDQALGYQDRQPLAKNEEVVKFTSRVESVTTKLRETYKSVIHVHEINTIKTSLEDLQSTSTSSCNASRMKHELDGASSTAGSPQSTNPSHRLSMSCSHSPGDSALKSLPQRALTDFNAEGVTQAPPVVLDSWKTPFAVADPMSNDIETASYLILAEDMASPSQSSALHTLASPTRLSAAALHAGNGPSHITQSVAGDTQSIFTPPGQHKLRRVTASRPKYRIVNTDPTETLEASSSEDESDVDLSNDLPESMVPAIPRRNSRRALGRGSLIIAQNRKAKVFDWDYADGEGLKDEDSNDGNSQAPSRYSASTSCATPSSFSSDSTTDTDHTARIIRYWNSGNLAQAELQLGHHLSHQPQPARSDLDRRIRHLLGVIASLEGKWEQALLHFASVLTKPILDTKSIDDADCAAAYWMGDIYALSNRRTEALIAYSIVKQGVINLKTISTDTRQRFLEQLQVEQNFCRSDKDREYLKQRLDGARKCDGSASTTSLLDPDFMSSDTAHRLLELVCFSTDSAHTAKSNQSRVMALSVLETKATAGENPHNLQLSASALSSTAPWPMPFDPRFCIGNVACGLPFSIDRNLLELKTIPRASGALSRKRLNCFTCQGLQWLILTLRACMEKFELKYTEFANPTSTCLIAQYVSTDGPYASMHFISISIFRLTIRSGFGVDICPGGIFSSRITQASEEVQAPKLKRVKDLIRNYLDVALIRQEALEDQLTAVPVMSINGVTSIHRGSPVKGKQKRQSMSHSSPASSSRSGGFSLDSLRR